jgi:hypothetical protein
MRWLRIPLLAVSFLTGTCMAMTAAPAWSADPEVWFNPLSPLDFPNMWTSTAPWQNAAGKVQVLEIVHWWIDTATDQQILAITNFAKLHHMKIAMGTQAVERFPGNPCGTTEGYSWPGQLTGEAATLHRLGVKLDIMSMDEPVWFAHYDTEGGSCQLSVPDLAANIASNISGILALYPDIQIYEIEPLPGISNFPDWRSAESEFHARFAQATGNHVRGIELDMGWSSPAWIPALSEMLKFTHEQNLRLGVIEDSSPVVTSDATAVASVVQNFEYMEGVLGIIPDFAEFTTWLPHPQYNMPETSPSAQTWEINRYFRERTLIQAQFVGQGVQGKLTDQQGKPVVGATINGYVPGVDFTRPLETTVMQGVVPSNAAYGLIGIRLNAECGCNGINDVLVGSVGYQETQSGSRSQNFLYSTDPGNVYGVLVDGEWVGGTKVMRLIATAIQPFYANSNWFPVTPGASYSFTVPASTIGGEGWYGNVFLLWADSSQNGFLRVIVIPGSGKRLMSTATTAVDGTFQLSKLPRIGPGAAPVTVEFAGDDTHRSTGWMPLH